MAQINNATFDELNGQAEIFPGKANYWVIVSRRSDLLGMKPEEQADAAEQVLEDFMRAEMIPHDELRVLDVWPAEGIPKGNRIGLVQPQPMSYPEGSVFLSFTWDAPESSRSSVPWPWEWRGMHWSDVQVGLVSIHKPGQVVSVPSALDNVLTAASNTVEQVKEDAGQLGKTAAVIAVGGLAALYALSRFVR